MAIKPDEIRKMTLQQRNNKLKELRNELMHERGVAAMGGAPANPGKIRSLRGDVARILTIIREEKLKEER